jgi:Dyp-type peroxidase family
VTATASEGTTSQVAELELADIQASALRPRPNPYAGAHILLRIDDRADGRELLRRLIPLLTTAADKADPQRKTAVNLALTHRGLQVLGVPQESLDSFAPEFREGMAARAAQLGDVGENAPENWEAPLGSPDVHVAVAALGPDAESLDAALTEARAAFADLSGVTRIWRQDVYSLPNERTSFGFKDGISHPAVEGSGVPGTDLTERPLKAGEFVLGYVDETGELPPMPAPDVLGRNGTYVTFRKLHTRVAAFRQYVHDRAADRAEEELLAAKFIGRWPSGAPLTLAPDTDDPELGADSARNNNFRYKPTDARGLRCPLGAHARRMNPRDSDIVGEVRLHRMIRRSASYGPMLPPGVTEDDGADRGILFACVGSHLGRQFEFVKTQWVNDGSFFGAPGEMDPLVGPNDGTTRFTVPRQPIRRRLTELPRFVVNRGGEYCFQPGLRALRWITELPI